MDLVSVGLRWVHIVSAVSAVGGMVYIWVALMPSLAVLEGDARQSLQEALRSRWARVVHVSITLLLVTGLINFVRTLPHVPEEWTGTYHPLFGVKFLLAMAIFMISSLLTGRSSAAERMRAKARQWLSLNLVLALLLILISNVLGQVPKSAPPVDPAPVEGAPPADG